MRPFLSLLLLVLITGCQQNPTIQQDEIIQAWRFSEVIPLNGQVDDTMLHRAESKALEDGYVVYFFPDGVCTEVSGYEVTNLRWDVLEDNSITFGDKILLNPELQQINNRDFLLAESETPEGPMKFRWVSEGKMLTAYKKDPFYPANNKWRIKPKHKESDAELYKRLYNYLQHFAYILDASIQREQEVVSFENSMGPVRVYSGGIGQLPINYIDEQWIDCFYDAEDAMKAYDLFGQFLTKSRYRGGTTGNWVKDDYKIMLHLLDVMKTYEVEKQEEMEMES